MEITLSDWNWLLSEEGDAEMRQAAALKTSDELKQLTFLREKRGLTPIRAALCTQQLKLRKKATVKFGGLASKMFFTPVGLEQSTDIWVAEYAASRFPSGVPTADICCGIGGNLMALAKNHPVLGVDLNPITAATARKNLHTFLDDSFEISEENSDERLKFSKIHPKIQKTENFDELNPEICVKINVDSKDVCCFGAMDFLRETKPEEFPNLHVDPDRRSEGVRTSQIEWFEPGQEVVERLIEGRQIVAVKLAPGTKVPENWEKRATELEWIGRGGECRQLLVWFRKDQKQNPDFPARATLLESASSHVKTTFCGKRLLTIPAASKPGRFIFDLDATVLAAGLEGAVAERFGLQRLGPGSLYLTGDEPICTEPVLSCFEILEVLPLDRKKIVKSVRERGWNILEIKKRGNVPEPKIVRDWFHLPKTGTNGTIILAEFEAEKKAFLVNRYFSNNFQ